AWPGLIHTVVVTTQPIRSTLTSTASARTKMASPMTTESQSSLIQGADWVALQAPRAGAVSMTDMSVSPVTRRGNRATVAGRALRVAGRSPWDSRQRREHDQQDEGHSRDRDPALEGQDAGEARLLVAHARLAFFRTARA